MSIDTAAKRRAAGGVVFLPLGPGVTPDVAKGADWRARAAWSYGSFGGGGSTVLFYNGVSTANGTTYHQGISRPAIALADAGGGTYTVTKTGAISGYLRPDRVSHESYLIDGQLP